MNLLNSNIPYTSFKTTSNLVNIGVIKRWTAVRIEDVINIIHFDPFEKESINTLFKKLEGYDSSFLDVERLNYLQNSFSALIYKSKDFKDLYFSFDNISNLLFNGKLSLNITLKDKILKNNTIHEYIAGFLDFNSENPNITINSIVDNTEVATQIDINEGVITEYFSVYCMKQYPSLNEHIINLLDSILEDFNIKYNYLLTEVNLLAKAYLQPLTQIGNRSYIDEMIDDLFTTTEEMSVLFIDLNNFKQVNDIFGHDAGDEVLINFGDIIKIISYDKGGIVGHYGGDEFIIILPGISKNSAIKMGQKIVDDTFNKIIFKSNNNIEKGKIAASIGISTKTKNSRYENCSPKKLLKDADTAMFNAKKIGDKKYGFVSHFDDLN